MSAIETIHAVRTTAEVGPDGRLRLDLPLGLEHAGSEVEVLVTSPAAAVSDERPTLPPGLTYPPGYRKMTREEYLRFIDETAGSIEDPTFVRPGDPPPTPCEPSFD